RWEVRLSSGSENGRRRRISLYAASQRDAVRLLQAKRHARAQQPSAAASAGQTVEQHLRHWLEDSVARTRRPGTYLSYEAKVRLYITPVIGKVRLADLGLQHVDQVLAGAVAKGNAPSTVALLRNILSIALNRGMKW